MRPTTDQSKKASGTFTPARARVPLGVPVGLPQPPEWLSEGAKKVWESLVPDLQQTGVLARVDWLSLTALCELAAEFSEGPRKFSAGKLKEMRMLLAECGCSISSRLKMKAPEGAPETPEKWTPKSGGNVVSISQLLSGTPKGSSPEASKPADTSASPASDS